MQPRSSWDRITPELPACPHERAVGDGLAHRRHLRTPRSGGGGGPEVAFVQVTDPLHPGELGHHRFDGEGHVRPGVAVGHGVDVQTVDGILVEAQDMAVGTESPREVASRERPDRLHGRGC